MESKVFLIEDSYTLKHDVYKVIRLVNSTDPLIGSRLKKKEVDDLIKKGVHVEISINDSE